MVAAPRLAYIVTHPVSARHLLRGQLAYMQRKGFEVTVISGPGAELDLVTENEGVVCIAVPMTREINLFGDLLSLIRLCEVLRQIRPHIVNASTPKAGFIGAVGARLTRVPICIYTLRGLRLETTRGLTRWVLGLIEMLTCTCADKIICVSESLRRLYVSSGFTQAKKTCVLANGSSNGVNIARFEPTVELKESSRALRERHRLPHGVPVIGFVGRLTRDKGIEDLWLAFQCILGTFSDAYLLLVGDFEMGSPVPLDLARALRAHPQVIITGWVPDTAPVYALMDVLVFPSYREGFPNAPLEAAASGVPVVGYAATGTVDAIVDGVTGTLVPVGNVTALITAVEAYLRDPVLRHRHGQAARERVLRDFRQEVVWEALYQEYVRLLREKGLPVPQPDALSEATSRVAG